MQVQLGLRHPVCQLQEFLVHGFTVIERVS
jgi:hypothetical protein